MGDGPDINNELVVRTVRMKNAMIQQKSSVGSRSVDKHAKKIAYPLENHLIKLEKL